MFKIMWKRWRKGQPEIIQGLSNYPTIFLAHHQIEIWREVFRENEYWVEV